MTTSVSQTNQKSMAAQRVHIELQRVQTWLFAVPRLRAMVGANTMLGETLRMRLPKLARSGGNKWQLKPLTGSYPAADTADPLQQHDDPSTDARDGILSRDGGHFEAQFEYGADEFARAAAKLLRRELPGLRFRIRIDGKEWSPSRVYLSNELPVLAPCEWTGRGLASVVISQGNEQAGVSLDVARRHQAAKRAENHQANDLASLLEARTALAELQRPQDLHDLVGSGYLALLYADGNGVGSSAGTTDEERARLFHRNRVLLRRALKKAIEDVCKDATGMAPLVLLMLGGDDLLVVCRAEKALPFVVSLCEELARLQGDGAGGFELTLGVGVVIAQRKIPIHRLHDIVEQLVSSAKRRFRGLKDNGDKAQSVVDWAVYTTSWVDDPEEIRRRDWICGTGEDWRVLSQRPVNVLGDGLHTLQGLLKGAEKLQTAPRSQLRYLVEQLPRGRALAELAFAELSKEARDKLSQAGVEEVWQPLSNRGTWITPLLDLVEIAEIPRLGHRIETQSNQSEHLPITEKS
ncbi:hypothetical protein HRbin30_03087 [bacterium HR30]|uniref:CRISPR-associated polymerase n=1 Tax=uncultured Bacteroidota bacterium TaxID=152509 RepID=H5S8L6_9BACT|nr:CRISPR-associated polymerase [uncultured Bacteroidetes bacterium]GBD27732.1 hypothetical protein HRbin30_03087 [bacterium HR30]